MKQITVPGYAVITFQTKSASDQSAGMTQGQEIEQAHVYRK